MDNVYGTTPFGQRPMSLAMLAAQRRTQDMPSGLRRGKWKLFRAVCEARPHLGLTDRALTVLDALLTFHPGDELDEAGGLIVFPSNAQLSLRARAMTPATLRRHLAALVEAGLIARKDSPNGKRYARRDRQGEIGEAYGFSLAPLLARAEEIEALAAEVAAERLQLRTLREKLTLCRRDISKLIDAALEEGAAGDWMARTTALRALVFAIPRIPGIETLKPLLAEFDVLRRKIVNMLEKQENAENMSGNESHFARHKQNSNPNSTSEFEQCFETKPGASAETDIATQDATGTVEPVKAMPVLETKSAPSGRRSLGEAPAFPLGLVLQACPQMADYGPGGAVRSWRDLMAAAVVVRSMLGVSPSAYETACGVMGPENAAMVIGCILERAGQISSAGGYLRDLTRRAERGEFAIGPMLMAQWRGHATSGRETG